LIRADFCFFLDARAMHAHVYAVSPGAATDESASTIEISEVVGKKNRPISHIHMVKNPAIYIHICTRVVRVLCCDNV
jgi:hypothetical protein